MHLDQAVDPDFFSRSVEMFKFFVAQCRDNKKNGIRTGKRSLINLYFVKGEILAEKRVRNLLAYKCQIIEMAVKELFVRQDGDTVSAGLLIGRSSPYRIKIGCDNSSRRGSLLYFSNESE